MIYFCQPLNLDWVKNTLNSQPLNEKVGINMDAEFRNTFPVPAENATWLSITLQQI